MHGLKDKCMEKIYFKLHNPCGMINQVMSLELAVGIANQTKAEVVVHNTCNNGDQHYDFRKVPIHTPSRWTNGQRSGFTNPDQFPHLSDIVEYDENLTLVNERVDKFPDETILLENILGGYYFSLTSTPTEDEIKFADGRNKINYVPNMHLKDTLGWYSRFFYNRTKELDTALASVKFKQEYVELANQIAKSIGDFQGAHLRLTDHIRMFNTTQEMFEQSLQRIKENNLPIFLSTDEPWHKMVQDNKNKFIMLDEYIVNNFSKEFKSLQFQDEVVFGLLCNLVLQHSKYFIGTPGSTYTNYIQRKRNQNGLTETWDFFEPQPEANGVPYSWNDYPLDAGKKMWWREWQESKLNV